MKRAKVKLAIFEGRKIRRHWDEKAEKWYFSVVDIIAALTNSSNPQVYWRVLKKRLIDEGSGKTVTKCNGLKMLAADGKMRITDVADTETVFRIIQSIPSPNAEPFKLWLARVGYERVEETEDPERAINRAMQTYLKKGYSREWINQRLKSIEIRKGLTDEWEKRGAKEGLEFATLTDDITFAWAGLTTKQYKRHKGLKMQSLRDNMTNLELVLNMLAEVSTTEISQKEEPDTFDKNRNVARRGGGVARVARRKIEIETGKKVISESNYLSQDRKKLKIND
ncbi:Bro-N domain-containing protein [Candidatus Daviesbacteria bacterium]|nr:Bro-N domain-containing protein [Candidatus Daviesbacteria bacterium]